MYVQVQSMKHFPYNTKYVTTVLHHTILYSNKAENCWSHQPSAYMWGDQAEWVVCREYRFQDTSNNGMQFLLYLIVFSWTKLPNIFGTLSPILMGFSAKQSSLIAWPNKLINWNLIGPDIRLISLDCITYYIYSG